MCGQGRARLRCPMRVIRCRQTWIAGSEDLQPDHWDRGSVGPLAIFGPRWSAVSNPAFISILQRSPTSHQRSGRRCRCCLSLALPLPDARCLMPAA